MSDVIFNYLRSVTLFKELSDDELLPIADISYMKLYKTKSFIYMQGDPLDRVFFLYAGKLKIHRTDVTGKEQIVAVPQVGEMFPHVGLFRKGSFPAHAEVLKNAQVVVTPITEFEQILIKHPELCMKMFTFLAEKIIDLQDRLVEQILHSSYDQIVMLLIRLCKSNGVPFTKDLYLITTHFTNRELANMIGSSRETINRTLNQLRKKQLVSTTTEGNLLIHLEKLTAELN
ncbi:MULTISPECIES: Crp/Fnr family transcriptional regulator [Bacillaceae]|uniref:Crp/Fnr family transcriptional regulator n=1 Tax=Bacillaceae TaxID=186817 RepID=UPI001E53EC63|nr:MULTISPECIES: Crp/Fnr family transcriptional regulator [Bacillaceae]MCE4049079.1 Crp/Fnr family transcriptional regulator [Bacillus sp. Au-Bac7]MCM3030972.1 Crp/Fnr family transcriptional regulator [Niallia sp. MER 6]